jgi:hypothetical protein
MLEPMEVGPMRVNVDNFVRAETALQFDRMVALAGGANRWAHNRAPTPIDQQNVIRMNRDTLYSFAIVDIADGAVVALPETDGRYQTVMVVNEDEYINRVLHTPGEHELTAAEFDTDWVLLTARTLVDPGDPDDVIAVNALQDQLGLRTPSQRNWTHPAYDEGSHAETRDLLLALARGVPDTHRMFGSRDDVDPVRHLIGAAFGWGGLPEAEAFYITHADPLPVGEYTLTVGDVPVDGFWSLSIYDRDGFFEPNPYDAYSLNSVTATASADGTVTVDLGPAPRDAGNHLYVMDGWNYVVRMYQPRREVLDGTWTFPEPAPA